MAELKTKLNDKNVEAFLNSVSDTKKRQDCFVLLDLVKKTTKFEPKMWGDSIVGFGSYHYKSKSGQEGDWFLTGFSPRKQNLTIYIISGFDRHESLMKKIGKHKTSKGCLYIKSVDDINLELLGELIEKSVEYVSKMHK